jgi:hypothetical protein
MAVAWEGAAAALHKAAASWGVALGVVGGQTALLKPGKAEGPMVAAVAAQSPAGGQGEVAM